MYVLDGQWYMEGIEWDDEGCIHSSDELLSVIESVGFLPLFSSGVPGFSVEEMTDTSCWWSGDISVDPWEWRAVLARTGKVAYGKFYGGRAGFISKKWFPYFANYRRDGYDFDALYEDGKAGYREKLLMDLFVPSGVDMWNVKTSSLEGMGLASSLYTNEMKENLARYQPGGVICCSFNIKTPEQTSTLIDEMQKSVKIPLFIGVDHLFDHNWKSHDFRGFLHTGVWPSW